ncbi:PREDICTED: protein ELYS isoform X2 [Dinoponera quadriceps]|uniref:Protein ELYS isoform X2 n=1 Tax=Dinoponera quadriceps TaxID=609295 RepID=A0A6P3XZX4_DINQU|nr:PREDICTED: protein ELYS isoform X2 [Dinoponera quadriceps]
MKEFEEVNCEIRRTVDLPLSVSNRLRNLEAEEQNQSAISQEHNDTNDCYGGFLHNATYAWLSYDCHFVVFNAKTGESISSWTFRGTVTSVSQFPTQSGDLPLLLIGIDNNASRPKDSSGLLCIFDCTVSRVLRAIRMPCGVEKVCVISGGAEWEEFNEKRPDNVLNEMDGIACVVLRDLQHIMIDLRRSTWDVHDLSTVMDETSPAEMDLSAKQAPARGRRFSQERHAAYNLLNNRVERYIGFNREEFESSPLFGENLTTAIVSSTKIGCLITGCLGRVIIWQNDGSVGWISAPIDENMAVTHLALLEPTDDPRPFCYLWAVLQDESSSRAPSVLRMYAMLFERKYCDRGINLYFNLEADPSLKFEFELSENERVVGLCTVEREANPEQTDSGVKKGEDNLLLISTSSRTLLFDLNQWYKEQMPRTIDECQNPNSILATYRVRSNLLQEKYGPVVNFAYVPLSLREFPSNGPSSPEELFYPNSLSLEWVELSPTRLTFWMTRGVQADLLREMAIAGPVILLQPSETFHRCLAAGLVPFNSEFSFASDYNAQREMLLSLCLEQRWSTFLVRCALDWADGSAAYLYPSFLKWGVQRASTIKILADRLCVPLFDQSGSGIGEADVRTLRFCSQQLECLSNVVAKLPFGTADLATQRRTLKRVSTYFQVLLWFYDVGLLPETQELEEETLPISLALKVPYPYEKLSTSYKEKRGQIARTSKGGSDEEEEVLFIDELITRECSVLKEQWEREGGLGGCYPPPSLQSLLRSYLTDCQHTEPREVSCKHQITIYLLMDLAMLLQRLYPGVDQLIKYPSAFKMSPSLIKLTQAFWLLDHEDYQGFLDMMTGQLVSDSDVKDWHHRFILRTLVRNNQHKLALVYLRVRKPPLSSVEEQSVAVSLSVEHGLVQSAFHRRPPCHYEQLLTCFFRACKTYGRLDEILHLALDSEEEEVFVKFLQENKTEDVRLLYYLQRCRYTEAIGGDHLARRQPSFLEDGAQSSMLGAYNTTLPDITKRFSANAAAISLDVEAPRYPRPMSHCRSHDRLRGIHETVIAKARETYLRGEKCQIPFVSAPCMSLRLNHHGASVNCVLFPARKSRRAGKRTVDQIYEEGANDHDVDCAKRRKLSDGSASPNRSTGPAKESELSFATPLVKRKFNASKDVVCETPHSILKIRRLIRSSVSPGDLASSLQEKELVDGFADNQSKKTSRQIRFSVNQPKEILQYEDEAKEEREEGEKVETKVGEEEDERGNDGKSVFAGASSADEVFLSPDANDELCGESAVLSGNSSISSRNYCLPRPRPSLRRSALQSSVEMLQGSSDARRASGASLSATTSLAGKPSATNTSGRRSSLQSAGYSTTMLSSDSDVSDYSMSKLERITLQSRWSFSVERDRKSGFTSSTPLTKKIVFQRRVNDELFREEDDGEGEKEEGEVDEKEGSKSPVGGTREVGEELDVPGEPERFSNIEQPVHGKSELMEDSPERNARGEQSEDKYDNGVARREASSTDGEQPAPEKVAEPRPTASDESDEELFQLQYSQNEDEEEDDEVFKSLSIEDQVAVSRLPDTLDPEERDKRSNGLRESVRVTGDVDFTDDESTSKDEMMVFESGDADEKKTHSTVAASGNVLYDMSNITDDESDGNFRESEEPKNSELPELSRRQREKSQPEEGGVSGDDVSGRGSGGTVPGAESREEPSEAASSSKRSQPVRATRSRRASSKDAERVTRSRRGSSTARDLVGTTTSDSSSRGEAITERPAQRARRAGSVAKDSPASEPRRRASSIALDTLLDPREADPAKPVARLRRANSSKDISLPARPRSRRASSLAKEAPSESTGSSDAAKKGRGRSAAKEAPSEPKDEPAVRRSARLTSSARKEADAPSRTRCRFESDDEEDTAARKRSVRARRSSVTGGSPTTELAVKASRARRGSSAPKEVTVQTGRKRRSSSIMREVLPEDAELFIESSESPRRLRSSFAKEMVDSPAANTRRRSMSIQSIPEELEDILSQPSRETRSAARKETASARERRAASADVSHKELRIRLRRTGMRSIVEEPVAEEAVAEERRELREDSEVGTPPRRRRAPSVTALVDAGKDEAQRASTSEESGNMFSFSKPEKVDVPSDEKDIGEVPNYVFSPPQTRSKNVFPNQHRRKIKSFIPSPYQKGVENPAVQKPDDIVEPNRYCRVTVKTYGSRFRTKFVIPNKTKSAKK